jgi:hypothetical protein
MVWSDRPTSQPKVSRGSHSLVDLRGTGHAGGNDHRLAGARHLADQRQVGILERGDLEGRYAEGVEEIDCGVVEGRAETVQAMRGRALHDGFVPVPGRVCLLVQLVELAAGPQALVVFDDEAAGAHVERHRVGGVGLQLDRVGAGGRGGVDDGECALKRLVVVARHLGTEVGALVRPDFA